MAYLGMKKKKGKKQGQGRKGKKQDPVTFGTLGIIGRTKETITITVPCSCGGENERCYKCGGTGIEEKRVLNS